MALPPALRPAPAGTVALHACLYPVSTTVSQRLSAAPDEATTLMARIGFASRGLIYLLIGGSAARAALQSGAPAHGFTDSVHDLMQLPLGRVLVVLVALGLVCFAVWLAIRSFTQARRGQHAKRWLLAAGMLSDAVLYTGFVVVVLSRAFGGGNGGDRNVQLWTGWLFSHTAGRTIIGLTGLGLIAGGISMVVWIWSVDVEKSVALAPRNKEVTEAISRYGLTGRAAALALIGGYLLAAAIDADPSKAHGLGGVLQSLRRASWGWAVVLLFGSAFGASAFFDFIEALYRRRG
jgi:hypothetical protein